VCRPPPDVDEYLRLLLLRAILAAFRRHENEMMPGIGFPSEFRRMMTFSNFLIGRMNGKFAQSRCGAALCTWTGSRDWSQNVVVRLIHERKVIWQWRGRGIIETNKMSPLKSS
jgi:hypothetical protein